MRSRRCPRSLDLVGLRLMRCVTQWIHPTAVIYDAEKLLGIVDITTDACFES
jgi:hypothetical protein